MVVMITKEQENLIKFDVPIQEDIKVNKTPQQKQDLTISNKRFDLHPWICEAVEPIVNKLWRNFILNCHQHGKENIVLRLH